MWKESRKATIRLFKASSPPGRSSRNHRLFSHCTENPERGRAHGHAAEPRKRGTRTRVTMATSPARQCVGLALLCVQVWLSESGSARVSAEEDVLQPYTRGHGPSHSHLHVRECQPVVHGRTTHETWPSGGRGSLPLAQSSAFISHMPGSPGGSRWVHGHMTVVHDPLRTLSVLEPGGPGGCERSHRVTVEDTAEAAGCLYALNAGFFNTSSNQCLGNVVSDGRMVQDSMGVQNAQFGIREDGSLVFGYLSRDDVLDQSNPFVQLVSGVVWLLRNGEVYINQSLTAECDKTQEKEMFRGFVDVLSARTVVGHDADGNLILFHVDGQTERRGMNLWEVADFLKNSGVINAVNLDGGGSSSFVMNGALVSYPPDQCKSDSRWRCARRVSTVLCVHPRRCRPPDCGGHGDCVDGRCRCREGWQGAACDALVCQPPECGAHGVCTAGGCVCAVGWTGLKCSQECLPGYYGDGCRHTCMCFNGASCNHISGRCTCPPGFHGNACEQVCPPGFFGLACAQRCQCEDQCPCDPETGSCAAGGGSRFSRAGQCLAKRMFTVWMREQDVSRCKAAFLSERTWLIISVTLASLLLIRLGLHLVGATWRWLLLGYSYSHVPLSDSNAKVLSVRLPQLH
ncbi:uncharacterized protein V6R79_015768 [Siganus canaliculatus]